MGIKDLNKFIKSHAPNAISVKTISELVSYSGKKHPVVAIDGDNMMYRYLFYAKNDPFCHITYLLHQIKLFKSNGIYTIMVFDGKTPVEKGHVHKKRSDAKNKLKERITNLEKMNKLCCENIEENLDELMIISNGNSKIMTTLTEIMTNDQLPNETNLNVIENNLNDNQNVIDNEMLIQAKIQKIQDTVKEQLESAKKCDIKVFPHHFEQVKEILNLINCPYIISCCEGEGTCSELVKQGLADYVLSIDTDPLVFGAQKSIRFHKNTEKEVYDLVELQPILDQTELTHDQFIDLCILFGCDYTETIYNVGPVKAYELIKQYKTIDGVLEFLTEYKKFEEPFVKADPKIRNRYKGVSWNPETFEYKKARKLFKLDLYSEQLKESNLQFLYNEDWKESFMNPQKINKETLVNYMNSIEMPERTIKIILKYNDFETSISKSSKELTKNCKSSKKLKEHSKQISNFSILNFINQ